MLTGELLLNLMIKLSLSEHPQVNITSNLATHHTSIEYGTRQEFQSIGGGLYSQSDAGVQKPNGILSPEKRYLFTLGRGRSQNGTKEQLP